MSVTRPRNSFLSPPCSSVAIATVLAALGMACGPATTTQVRATPATARQVRATGEPRPTATPSEVTDVTKVNLPAARNGLPLLEETVPTVSVVGGKVYLGGEEVGDATAIVRDGRLQRVDGLWKSLTAARDRWNAANSGKPFDGIALFAFDAAAPAVLVKSVFQTAAFAGYPNAQFAVRNSARAVVRLDVDAMVPGPPMSVPSTARDRGVRLLVVVRPAKYLLVWRKDEAVISTTEVASLADLPGRVRSEWALHAAHRERNDKAFDQAVLYVGDDVDYAGIVAVVDAIHATTREFAVDGATEQVRAIDVILGVSTDISPSMRGSLAPEKVL